MSCRYGGNLRKLCSNLECNVCEDKSFKSVEQSVHWNYEKNVIRSDGSDIIKYVTPRDICKSSKYMAWFTCPECKHIFEKTVSNIRKVLGCPFCANQRLCDTENCPTCLPKSFAMSNKIACWDYSRNTVDPAQIFIHSNTLCYFICDKCGHSIQMSLNSVSAGRWCGYCAGQLELCGNTCIQCFNRSAASHWCANFWSSENEKIPIKTYKYVRDKIKFICAKGHEFELILNKVTDLGRWCPYCKDNQITEFITELSFHYLNVITNHKPKWSTNTFDLFIPQENVLVEFYREKNISAGNSNFIISEFIKIKSAIMNNCKYVRIHVNELDSVSIEDLVDRIENKQYNITFYPKRRYKNFVKYLKIYVDSDESDDKIFDVAFINTLNNIVV